MLKTLRNPTFRHLFAAQLVALLGTGLATVALGLLAWQLAAIGTASLAAVLRLWPADDQTILAHDHPDLPQDHPHLAEHQTPHAHAVVIDEWHRRWPKAA
jgi:hypothetical protein